MLIAAPPPDIRLSLWRDHRRTRGSKRTSFLPRNSGARSSLVLGAVVETPLNRGKISNQKTLRMPSLIRTRRIHPALALFHSNKRCSVLESQTGPHRSPPPRATREVIERAIQQIQKSNSTIREFPEYLDSRTCPSRARWRWIAQKSSWSKERGPRLKQFAWYRTTMICMRSTWESPKKVPSASLWLTRWHLPPVDIKCSENYLNFLKKNCRPRNWWADAGLLATVLNSSNVTICCFQQVPVSFLTMIEAQLIARGMISKIKMVEIALLFPWFIPKQILQFQFMKITRSGRSSLTCWGQLTPLSTRKTTRFQPNKTSLFLCRKARSKAVPSRRHILY